MFRLSLILLLSISTLFLACKSENKLSDTEQIEKNVQDYFFLGDSVAIEVEILDTIFIDELDKFIATIEKNLNLVDQDLDSLSLMIDDKSYKKLAFEKFREEALFLKKKKYSDSINVVEKGLLEYRLMQSILEGKRTSFSQTKRILLHLKRSIWANISGYNINVHYTINEAPMVFKLLLDANYNIID